VCHEGVHRHDAVADRVGGGARVGDHGAGARVRPGGSASNDPTP
jgi:hypothetical protein